MILITLEFNQHSLFILQRKKENSEILPVVLSDRYKGYDICFLDSNYATSSITYISLSHVTSAVGRNGYIFVTADSTKSADPDLYIIKDGAIKSALSTGPGLRDIAVTKEYVYVANTSSLSQVQKIDIRNIYTPHVVASYSFASTGNAIRFDQDKIYIGAEKAYSPELAILDTNLSPFTSFETSSQINDIYITNKVYVAASDINQLHILGESSFSPSGWETQQGKSIAASGSEKYFGRTVGGFNNKSNHELFLLGSTSVDIGTGVYGLLSSNDLLFIASKGVQVWKKPFTYMYTISLQNDPISISCDKNKLVLGLKDGVAIINFAYAY